MPYEFANTLLLGSETSKKSQSKIAFDCDVSTRMWTEYLGGKALPTARKVIYMAEILKCPELLWAWMRSNEVGSMMLPPLPTMPLSKSFSNFALAAKKAVDMHYDLLTITLDDIIDEHELKIYRAGNEVIWDLIANGAKFTMARQEKTAIASSGLR